MNIAVLSEEVQDYIERHHHKDATPLLFKKPIFEGVSNTELLQQLVGKQKCKKKLPLWFGTPGIYYPPKLNLEQTSSEITARYKTEIVSGERLVDITGGFGVDTYYFAKKMDTVVHCDINEELSRITAHNFSVLGTNNITVLPANGLQFLKEDAEKIDWIFIDPSRRNPEQRKVFRLADCTPDVISHFELLMGRTDNLLIKTAPLLDLSQGINELKWVKEIHIVAIQNEVKELLWVIQNGYQGNVSVKTINFTHSGVMRFDFDRKEEAMAISTFSGPQHYLYEPNAAILKSGAFKKIGETYGLCKLHRNTHLYTHSELRPFPGRRFKIKQTLPYSKKVLKALRLQKANISCRNFPETSAVIRKKTKIKDGGEHYFFFVKNSEEKQVVLHCEKIER